MGKNTRRNKKKKAADAGQDLVPSNKADAKHAWDATLENDPGGDLRRLTATWESIVEPDVVQMILHENAGNLQRAHSVLCDLLQPGDKPRRLLGSDEAWSESIAAADQVADEGALVGMLQEIFPAKSEKTLRQALNRNQNSVEDAVAALSGQDKLKPVCTNKIQPDPAQQIGLEELRNPYELLDQQPEENPEQQGELMNLEEGVQQLIDMFGVGKNEAILRLERNQGNLESAIEEYFTGKEPEVEAVPSEAAGSNHKPGKIADPTTDQLEAVQMLTNMFGMNENDAAELLRQHSWDVEAACNIHLAGENESTWAAAALQNANDEPDSNESQTKVAFEESMAQQKQLQEELARAKEQLVHEQQQQQQKDDNAKHEEWQREQQRQWEQQQEQDARSSVAAAAAAEAELESLVSALMDLFPQVPMAEARQIVQTSGCDLEAATAQTLEFIEAQTVSQQQEPSVAQEWQLPDEPQKAFAFHEPSVAQEWQLPDEPQKAEQEHSQDEPQLGMSCAEPDTYSNPEPHQSVMQQSDNASNEQPIGQEQSHGRVAPDANHKFMLDDDDDDDEPLAALSMLSMNPAVIDTALVTAIKSNKQEGNEGEMLSTKEKVRASIQMGKLLPSVEDGLIMDLLEQHSYSITRAFEAWLAAEDSALMAAEQEAFEAEQALLRESLVAEHLALHPTAKHRPWWPQQIFADDNQIPCALPVLKSSPTLRPKQAQNAGLIQMYDLFPEEDHGALCQVFEASQFDLERSVEAMLQVLNERAGVSMPSNPNSQSSANPALEQMQLVLVGWPVDQVASLLEDKQGDVEAALNVALNQQQVKQQPDAGMEAFEDTNNHAQSFLQNIFPDMPEGRIAAVLSRHQGDLQNSVSDLMLAASEMGGIDHADTSSAAFGVGLAQRSQQAKRKLDDLINKFPTLPRDVVEAVFAFNNFQLSKAVLDLQLMQAEDSRARAEHHSQQFDDQMEQSPAVSLPAEDENDGFTTVQKKARAPRRANASPPQSAYQDAQDAHVSWSRKPVHGGKEERLDWEQDNHPGAQLRRRAMQAGILRGQLLRQATEAYTNGQGALAKELSERGKEQETFMRKYHQEASNLIFLEKNPTLSVGSLKQIDLHGLTVDEAVTTTANYFKLCKSLRYRGIIKVITGRGNHSVGGVAKIKPAVQSWLEKNKFNHVSSNNGGVVEVALT